MKTQTLETFIIFHKLMFTVLHSKKKTKIVIFRDYEHFFNERFRLDLLSEMKNIFIVHSVISILHLLVFNCANKASPKKRKYDKLNTNSVTNNNIFYTNYFLKISFLKG